MELLPHSLTAELLTNWYSEFDRKDPVSPIPSVLYLLGYSPDASPKAISERTSYYGV